MVRNGGGTRQTHSPPRAKRMKFSRTSSNGNSKLIQQQLRQLFRRAHFISFDFAVAMGRIRPAETTPPGSGPTPGGDAETIGRKLRISPILPAFQKAIAFAIFYYIDNSLIFAPAF